MKNNLKFGLRAFALNVLMLVGIPTFLFAEKVAIIDAGSSGSRLFVYEVNVSNKQQIKLLYPITPEQKKHSKGRALSSIANHPDSVRVFLENMTANYVSDGTDLYILATAGMRLKSKAQADAIYDKLEAQPATNGYNVKGAMTITGQYEGLYGWLAANYEHGRIAFEGTSTDPSIKFISTPCGILEIGGASMQLAFLTDKESDDCLSRDGMGYVYCKSYLGGGVDQVFKNTPRKGDTYDFDINVDNVSKQYGKKTLFWGLGIPVNNVLNGIYNQPMKKTYRGKINAYIETLDEYVDTPQNYHPRINSHYIKKLFKKMDLRYRMIKPEKDASWTIGAAIDILVNGEKPAEFDHNHIK